MGGRHSRPLKRPLSRSENMARIRGRDTGPERLIRSLLWRRGFRYRLWTRIGRIRPDLVLSRSQIAVFVDGCFWHGCPEHYVRPRTSTRFWSAKLRENVERDRRQTLELEDAGWRVLRFWEHEVFVSPTSVANRIERIAARKKYRSRSQQWRVLKVTPRDSAGATERRTLITLHNPSMLRTENRRRTTKKW